MINFVPEHHFVPPVHQIAAIAAELTGFSIAEIVGPGSARDLARTRFAVEWVARTEHGRSYPEIGQRLGRDHTSVMHGVRRAVELRRTDAEFYQLCEQLAGRRPRVPIFVPAPRLSAPTIAPSDIEDDGFVTVVGIH